MVILGGWVFLMGEVPLQEARNVKFYTKLGFEVVARDEGYFRWYPCQTSFEMSQVVSPATSQVFAA